MTRFKLMNRLTVGFLSLILSAGIANSQIITGKVTDRSTGVALSDVAVVVMKSGKGTVTDQEGNFMLSLEAGKHTLEFRHVGYHHQRKDVTFAEGMSTLRLEIGLEPEIYHQEQIVVTASKTGMHRDIAPMNVSVINSRQIGQSTESNILPVISGQIPGVFVTERGVTGFGLAGGSAGKISIRGVGGSDASFPVLLLIDGQPQFMGMMGHALPDTYVSTDIEKVEVVKGPASILYGTNAMGGAINLITRRQKDEGFDFRGRIMYGSFNTQKYTASTGFKKGRLDVTASYNHDQTDGDRPNSAFNIDNGYLRVGYRLNDHFAVDGNVSHSSFKAYDPGSIYAPNPSAFDNNSQWVDIQRSNAYFTLSNHFEKSEGGLKGYYMTGDHSIYDGWKSKDENMGISLFQGLQLFSNNLISLGADIKKYGGRGEAPSLGNRSGEWINVNELGGYVFVQQRFFGRLTLNAGLRYDHHSVFGGTWVPQTGAAYNTGIHSTVKASISKGFRNPTVRELYLFPPANASLKPEELWNYELSYIQDFAQGRGKASITVYAIDGDNLIMVVPNPNTPPPVINMNSGSFYHTGFEVDARYRITDNLSMYLGYSFVDMETPKVGAPGNQFMLGGQYQLGKFEVISSLQTVGDLYTKVLPANEMVNESFTNLTGKISYRPAHQITLFVSGENLLNQDYQLQYGYPMPGTTMLTGMNIYF